MALRDPCAPSSTISGHLLGFPSCWQRQRLDQLQGAPLRGATMPFMEDSLLPIHLDAALAQQLEAACADAGGSRGEIVRDALRRQLSLMRFEQLRRQALPFGEAAGWLSDEDVFRAVS